jgi:excisionase family DNA binding protein
VSLGRELKQARELAGLSQARLGEEIDYSSVTICNVENGKANSSLEFWRRCDQRLGMNGAWLQRFRDIWELAAANKPDRAPLFPAKVRNRGQRVAEEYDADPFMSVSEIAASARLSVMTVYRAIHTGELESARFRRAFRVRKSAFQRWTDGKGATEVPPINGRATPCPEACITCGTCTACAREERLSLLAEKLRSRGLEANLITCSVRTDEDNHCDAITVTNPSAPQRGYFHIDSDGSVEWSYPGANLDDDGIGRIVDEAINALRANGMRLPRREKKESS